MYVNHYFTLILISAYFSFCVGKIHNGEYALNDESGYVMNKHPRLDGNASAPAVYISSEQPRSSCKVQSVGQYGVTPWYSMADVFLYHYGTQKRDSTGQRTYFELHFAVQTDGLMDIYLTEKENYTSGNRYAVLVGWDSNQHTCLWYNGATVREIDTPNILSSTQFRSFYIKIDDGKLQFGKKGDTTLITYAGIGLSSLNYYTFYIYGGSAKIRYCSAFVEGSS